MHKQLLSEAIITWTLQPHGPILVKAGQSGTDPTRPDMEFVRTWHEGRDTVYLPGSSLKGVIRAQCERIARTVAREGTQREISTRLACNPLKADAQASDGSCGEKFNRWRGDLTPEEAYRNSCFVCQMFGNTALAGRVRFTDAYPPTLEEYEETHPEVKAEWERLRLSRIERERRIVPTEERHGVAIDRVFGSVAVGPFQFEVATAGAFQGSIFAKNFSLAHLGLLALALHDLTEQRVLLGFAKSRGLGRVKVKLDQVVLRYPAGEFRGIQDGAVYGVGALLPEGNGYGARRNDQVSVEGLIYDNDDWGGRSVTLKGDQRGEPIYGLWTACVPQWAEVVRNGR